MDTPKPGYKTTEFWLSLVAMALGAVMASGVIAPETTWERVIGLVIAGLTSLGYTGARLKLKAKY